MPDEAHDEWSRSRKKRGRTIFGFVAGAYVIVNAVGMARHAVEDHDLAVIEIGLVVFMLLVGFAIALPHRAMPLIDKVLNALPSRKGGGE